MNEENIWNLVEHEAAKSPCEKRKVGCVIIDADGNVISTGYNFNTTQYECEDSAGFTLPDVMHAEVAAAMGILESAKRPLTAYVNHQPCNSCQDTLGSAGVKNVEVRETSERWDYTNAECDKAEDDYDAINPKHYSGLETYQAAAKNYDAYQGFLHLNAFKYIERMWHKENPAQDLKKSMWYLDKLKDTM